MITEKIYKAANGGVMFVLLLVAIAGIFVGLKGEAPIIFIPCILASVLLLRGFTIINPNESIVLVLFGKYSGTVRDNGFYWVNPFMVRTSISLRARNFNGQTIKVNDKLGNPIEIAVVIVWQVKDTAKALFEVNDYMSYVITQSEAAVRHLAGVCPYDNFEDDEAVITLRGSTTQVHEMLVEELNERLSSAGISVIEARISHLAYAQEIAGAMLQRQQATAVVSARQQIVEGAVGMVEMALHRLSQKQIVTLDEERKAAMVSNLLVVLCGDNKVTPVVNTGTLYN